MTTNHLTRLAHAASKAPLAPYLLALGMGYTLALLLIATAVRTARLLIPFSSYRLGQLIFPIDAGFVVGVLCAFVLYECSTRLLAADSRHRRVKRLIGFLLFATLFKLILVTPLAQPQAADLLPLRTESTRCEIYSNLKRSELDEWLSLCDAYITYFERHYGATPTSAPYRAVIYDEYTEYQAALAMFSVRTDALGVYLSAPDSVLMTRDAGLGTLTHELTHALFARSSVKIPPWATEGIPSFFEKFFALRDSGGIQFQFGFVHPVRWLSVREELSELDLIAAIAPQRRVWGAHATDTFIAYFLWDQGVFEQYLRRLMAEGEEQPGYLLNLLGGQSEDLKERWKQFVVTLSTNEQRLVTLPPSQIFSASEEWENHVRANSILK